MFPFFCKHNHEKKTLHSSLDVISSTAIVFLTCPLQLVLNHYGAAFFYGKTNMLYPYHLMDAIQKNAILDMLKINQEYNILNGSIVFKKSSTNITIPITTTLQTLCLKIYESQTILDRQTQNAVCNIILQRIQGYIPISLTVQKKINKWLQQHTLEHNSTIKSTP